jgi:biopolymer transport protein ExbB
MFWEYSLNDLLAKGGFIMWPLLCCSVGALALLIDRGIAHYRLRLKFRLFISQLEQLVSRGKLSEALNLCRSSRSPVARTAEAYLANLRSSDALRSTIIEREGGLALEGAEKRLRGLAAIAQVSTLIGLLGTVIGLVSAFHQIELNAGQVQPGDLAEGIWAALLTTVFGLCIAIPTFLILQVFESRVDRMARRMSYVVAYLDQWLGRKTASVVSRKKSKTEEPVASGAE